MPGCGSCCWTGKGRTSGGDRSGAAAIVATTDALSRALTRTPHREAPGPALPHTVTAIAATRTPLHTMEAHPLARSPSPGRLPHAVAAIAATADSPPPARDGNSPRHGQRPGPADSARGSCHRRHGRLAATRTRRQPAPPRPLRRRQPPSPSRQTHRHAHAATARLPRRASVSRRLPARGSRHPADSPRTGPANTAPVSRALCQPRRQTGPRTRQQPSRRRLVVRQPRVGARELPIASSAATPAARPRRGLKLRRTPSTSPRVVPPKRLPPRGAR